MIEFWKEHEQVLTFILVITYLCSFCFYFENEMRHNGWFTLLFLIQFFGLGTYMGIRGLKKGWRLPKNIKDTH